ncbi:GIN domain-containing protein [Brumimicrobium oceani]|nr:DUF2807 domain-containing protein [Brumimicrobium oceani]
MSTVLLFFSCKKANERICFKGTGEASERIVNSEMDIDTLYLYDNLYYQLIPSNESKVVLTGGENLLEHIEVDFNNGRLSVSNKNKCKFLRSFKNEIHAKIYVDSITYIYYEGSKELVSSDTLFSNELRLFIRDGAGSTNLTLRNGYTSATVTHGFGDFKLKGQTLSAYLSCSTNSYCDTRFFKVKNNLMVNSNTVGNMLVNASEANLFATILESGNIQYVGTPTSVSLESSGEGQLVDLNN